MSGHTKGPWERQGGTIWKDHPGRPITVLRGAHNDPVRIANARLIAAAPEMESALEPFAEIDGEGDEDFADDTKVIVSFGRTTNYSLTLGDFRRARDAHAKATTAPEAGLGRDEGEAGVNHP